MEGITDPNETYFKNGIWAWSPAANAWVRLLVDADGSLIVVIGGGDYVCVRDVKPRNTAGGGATLGAWRTRTINHEQADAAGICAIAANRITLQAGTYRCLISAPAYKVNMHQARLQNITDPATLITGTSEIAHITDATVSRSFIAGRFTLAAANALEVQHQTNATQAANGFGIAANFTEEIYTIAEFWREPG